MQGLWGEMVASSLSAKHGIYRTSNRVAEPAPAKPPNARTLLMPAVKAFAVVIGLLAPVAVFNLAAPSLLGTSGDTALVPWVDTLQDALMICALVAPLGMLVFQIVRRVRPAWRPFRAWQKIVYVAATLHFLALTVAASEYGVFMSRGGLHLFAPRHVLSSRAPDGRTAHVYESCFLGCTTTIYIAKPLSFTMTRMDGVPRRVVPSAACPYEIGWKPDGTIELLIGEASLHKDAGFSWGGC